MDRATERRFPNGHTLRSKGDDWYLIDDSREEVKLDPKRPIVLSREFSIPVIDGEGNKAWTVGPANEVAALAVMFEMRLQIAGTNFKVVR